MNAILHKLLDQQGKVQRHWVVVNTNVVLLLNLMSRMH